MAEVVPVSGNTAKDKIRVIKIVRLIWHRLNYCLEELQTSYSVSSVLRGTGYKYYCLKELPRTYSSAHADPKSNMAQVAPLSGRTAKDTQSGSCRS